MNKKPIFGTDVPKELMTVEKQSLCASCKQFKPTKQFQRRLTLAQTRATLRQPNATTRYIATSKNCADCRKKTKRSKPLTAKQIRTKMTSGDMSKIVGEMKLNQIKQAIPKKRARVMKEYWQKKKAEPLRTLKENLQQQVAKYANRYHASAHLQNATAEHNRYNYEQARRIRDELLRDALFGTAVPNDIQIATLIPIKPQ